MRARLLIHENWREKNKAPSGHLHTKKRMNAAIDRFLQMLVPRQTHRQLAPSPAVRLSWPDFAALVRAGDLIFYDGAAPTHTPPANTKQLARSRLARLLSSLIELLPCAPFALACCASLGDSALERGEDELCGAANKPHDRPVMPYEWCDWSTAALVVRVDGPNVVILATERSFDTMTLRDLATAPQSCFDSRLFAVRHLVISEEAKLMAAPEQLTASKATAAVAPVPMTMGASAQNDSTTARWRINIAERIGVFAKTVAQRAARLARATDKSQSNTPAHVRREEAIALAAMRRSSAFGALYALYIAHVFRSEPRIVDAAQVLQLSGVALSQRIADAYAFTDARCFSLEAP